MDLDELCFQLERKRTVMISDLGDEFVTKTKFFH